MSLSPERIEALAKIAGIKKLLGMAETPAPVQTKVEPKSIVLTEHEPIKFLDPFDDWEAYQDAMFKAKQQIPQAIYNCHNQAKEGAAWTAQQ